MTIEARPVGPPSPTAGATTGAVAAPPEPPARDEGRVRTRWALATSGAVAVVLALMLARHEPWADEAQAWLLARDASPVHLLLHDARYEGSPALWQLLLMPLAQAHLPYVSMNVLAAAASVAGAYLLMRHAPFPLGVRLLAAFAFFPLYEYGVVARSYSLLAPLLWLVAIAYPRRMQRPWHFVIPLCLLADLSVHGLLIAGSLVVLHAVDLGRAWSLLPSPERGRQRRALITFTLVAVLVGAQLWPPPDLGAGAGWNLGLHHLATAPALDVVHALGEGFVSVAVIGVTAWWLWRTQTLLVYLLPTTALLTLFGVKYFNVWHEGTLFLVWLFALWISMQRRTSTVPQGMPRLSLLPVLAAMGVALAIQLSWTIRSLRFDWSQPYSGSRALASYVNDHRLDGAVVNALGYSSIAVLPYFSHDIYANMNGGRGPSYWHWSRMTIGLDQDIGALLDRRPDYVVVSLTSDRQAPTCLPGYHRLRFFPGHLWWKSHEYEQEAYWLYGRDDPRTAAPAVYDDLCP